VIVGAAVTVLQQALRHRRIEGAALAGTEAGPEAARREAISELDRLLGGGPYTGDAERELFASSSAVVRRYAARLDPAWGPGLTSTELMSVFTARSAVLDLEMKAAERVKFGRQRSGHDTAEAHLRALRASLESVEVPREEPSR
jgi:hypothetical protein